VSAKKNEKLDRINIIEGKIINLSGFFKKSFFDFGEVLKKKNENQKSIIPSLSSLR